MSEQAEVVVIGAGPAGYPCAIRLAQLGKKVTIIDDGMIGGVCLNIGCIPSKALIYASSFYEKLQHAEEMGIKIKGKVDIDLPKLMTWKQSVVKKLTGGVGTLLKGNGCTVIDGRATFTGPNSLSVKTKDGTKEIQFKECVIATGSRPTEVPVFKVDQKDVLDSTGALSLKAVPKSMLCIGGGYIGMELGMFYAKLGTKVTVVEAGPRILGIVDPQLTRVVEAKMKKLGMKTLVDTKVESLKKGAKGVEVAFSGSKKETFEKVLVTIGRTPNTDKLDLDKAGVKTDKGFISVNAQRRTNIPNIYAIGDVAGQPLLAHKGTKEGLICAEVIAGKRVVYDVLAMPAVIFTDPEIATVGLTEAEAKEQGFDPMVGAFPYAANGRALSVGEPEGTLKIIGDKKTGRLLGVHIVGAEASNLIAEATLAIEMGAEVEDLALTVHAHPTLPEIMMEAAEVTLGKAVHIMAKKSRPAPRPTASP